MLLRRALHNADDLVKILLQRLHQIVEFVRLGRSLYWRGILPLPLPPLAALVLPKRQRVLLLLLLWLVIGTALGGALTTLLFLQLAELLNSVVLTPLVCRYRAAVDC